MKPISSLNIGEEIKKENDNIFKENTLNTQKS
jgi:hypothetical protein